MSFSVAGVMSIVIFLIVAYSSYRNGLYSTVVTLFIVVLSAAAALMCLGPMPRMMFIERMGWYAPPVCYLGVFLTSLVILQTLANYLLPPKVTLPKAVDVAGASVLGLVNALFVTGALMVGYALFPGTGEAEDKVVFPPFLPADEFFVRTMTFLSARTGSVPLDAQEFLRRVRKEKYQYSVRERADTDIDRENLACFQNLRILGQALNAYTTVTGGRFPEKLDDLLPHLLGRRSDRQLEELMTCPATKRPYLLFPVTNFADVKDDPKYVLLYDAVGGEAGHLGFGADKRPVLQTDFFPHWLSETNLRAYLQAQRGVMNKH